MLNELKSVLYNNVFLNFKKAHVFFIFEWMLKIKLKFFCTKKQRMSFVLLLKLELFYMLTHYCV